MSQCVDGSPTCIVSFTGTPDEDHFNIITYNVEYIGGSALSHALTVCHYLSPSTNDQALAAYHLRGLMDSLDECAKELVTMRDGCQPEVFYNILRPFLAGSKDVQVVRA